MLVLNMTPPPGLGLASSVGGGGTAGVVGALFWSSV